MAASGQTDRHTDRQTDRQTDRRTNRQTDSCLRVMRGALRNTRARQISTRSRARREGFALLGNALRALLVCLFVCTTSRRTNKQLDSTRRNATRRAAELRVGQDHQIKMNEPRVVSALTSCLFVCLFGLFVCLVCLFVCCSRRLPASARASSVLRNANARTAHL